MDAKTYSGLISRMASALDLEFEQPPAPRSDKVFQRLNRDAVRPTSVGMLPSLIDLGKEIWAKPSTSQSVPRRVDSYYKVLDQESGFLLKNPGSNSIVVETAQGKAGSREFASPACKEGRKLDHLGRRLFSSTSLSVRIANYQAMMGAYQAHLWDKLEPLLDSIPEDHRAQARSLFDEGTLLASQQIRSSSHAMDAASRGLATAVVLRRYSWLRSAGLTDDARRRIEDLPFDGEGLFNSGTDDIMENLQKKKNTAKRLGLNQSTQNRQQSYQPRPFQPFRSFTPRPQQSPTYRPRRQYPTKQQGDKQPFRPHQNSKAWVKKEKDHN